MLLLCPHCGAYAADEEIVCRACGTLLPQNTHHDTGIESMRQGKRARQAASEGKPPYTAERQGQGRTYVDPSAHEGPVPVYARPEVYGEDGMQLDSGFERPKRGVYVDSPIVESDMNANRPPKRKLMVNWMIVLLVCVTVLIGAAAGGVVFITGTDAGQRVRARLGMDTTSTALRAVAEERMNIGDIEGAIEAFRKAAEQDGLENAHVPGLLQLGNAYEAAGRMEEAERLYTAVFTEIVPSATEAYTNVIRIMLAQGREPEAADLMKLAYEKTGSATFYNQRNALLPQPPTISEGAGYYEKVLNVILASPQGYEVYFTFDDSAILPQEGMLYSEPLRLDENTWTLRCVSVNGDLISDERSATFRVSMPAPGTPYASLAPNTYKQRQKLRIWQNIERTVDPNITIYYTIDGSPPDADSPIYTGEPFWLPTGCYCELHAVSVNEYGKASNTLSVRYKIEASPSPKEAFTVDDVVNGLRPGVSKLDDFLASYGDPLSTEDVTLDGLELPCRKYVYDWGYAVFMNQKGSHLLAELHLSSPTYKGPRGTAVGNDLDTVIGRFRDMGQVTSPSGNRGLYWQSATAVGKMYINKNGTGKAGQDGMVYPELDGDMKIVRYTTGTVDGHVWQLDYLCQSDVVTAINMRYLQ